MKKELKFSTVVAVAAGLVLGGAALMPQAAASDNGRNSGWRAPKPVSAANIQIFRKVVLSPQDIQQSKGKPVGAPGKSKEEQPSAATGILGGSATGEKYAIIIGICDYPGSTSLDLCASDGDSLHMYKALVERYGYDPENIKLFKDMGGTTGYLLGEVAYAAPKRNDILAAIDAIKSQALSGDEVVFFFSGHGTNGYADDGDFEDLDEGIVVHDSDGELIDDNGEKDADGNQYADIIWDGELKDLFTGFATDRIAFVFDSCLAGGMDDVAGNGRVVSMATSENASAYVYSTAGEDVDGNGTRDGEGVFSRYFANEGMIQFLADGYNQLAKKDGKVAVEEAFDYVKNNIPPYLKNRQKPVISDGFENDLLLGFSSVGI